MSKMSFAQSWIELVMKCVDFLSYSILLKGIPQPFFKPSRGTRQGGPLSPYIFILCAEALSSLLNNVEMTGAITGVPLAKGKLNINHLFFADDILLFCRANSLEWSRLIFLLNTYEQASRQRLNKEKTSIQFTRNTSRESQ